MSRLHIVSILVAAAIFTAPVSADQNPVEIVQKAAEVAAKLDAVSYSASFQTEGSMAKVAPTIEAKVVAKRGATDGAFLVSIDGTITMAGTTKAEPFKFASDGKQFFDLNPSKKVLTVVDLATIPLMRHRASPVFPTRYLDVSAFKSELSSAKLSYAGQADVNGIACHIIKADYAGGRFGQSTLYFGQDDLLVRRIEREFKFVTQPGRPGEDGRLILVIADLNTQPEISDGAFKLVAPEGYRTATSEEFAKAGQSSPRKSRGLLEVGDAAPEFELPQGDGTKVSLNSLRGKYVVLDFWATWCGPCKRAMPELQKLHDHFKEKPVVVFGVNCRERGGDPMRYVNSKGYTYPQLLQGDRVATQYRVRGIPSIYVVDPEGKICFSFSGFDPRLEAMITNVIESGLEKKAEQEKAASVEKTAKTDR